MLTVHTIHHGSPAPLTIDVDVADAGGNVDLRLDPEAGETFDDRSIERTLTPAEARALAAALWHHADEVERGR